MLYSPPPQSTGTARRTVWTAFMSPSQWVILAIALVVDLVLASALMAAQARPVPAAHAASATTPPVRSAALPRALGDTPAPGSNDAIDALVARDWDRAPLTLGR